MTVHRLQNLIPLIVPSWIVQQIDRNKLPASTLLNLEKLLSVCSLEDVVVLYCLNTEQVYTDRIFGPGVSHPGLAEYWCRRFPTQIARVLELVGLYRGVPEERLFFESEPTVSGAPASKPTLQHVESQDLQVRAVAIVLKPGQLGGNTQREVQNYLVREYMRQLYVFTDYATLAADPLFARYLKNVTLDNVSEPA